MKCRGGFSPPDRLRLRTWAAKTRHYTIVASNSQRAAKTRHYTIVASNFQRATKPRLCAIVAFNSQRPLVYSTAGGPTLLLQPGNTWLKTLLSDELSANTLHLSDTRLWP